MAGELADSSELTLLTERVIGAAIEVHRHLGPGLFESAYQGCLRTELMLRGVRFECEAAVPLTYKGHSLACAYRVDFVIDKRVIMELKSVEQLLPIHSSQILTYLHLMNLKLGLIINFNSAVLVNGVRRVANNL